jgi:two-component system response regulator VicR
MMLLLQHLLFFHNPVCLPPGIMNKRILIIDDDNDMLEMLEIIFQNSDYDLVLSNKGMKYDQIRLLHPDLVLLDVRIDGYEMTGDKICSDIKTHDKELPIFLISGEKNLAQIAGQCAADDYLNKPFDINVLKTKVSDRLNKNF